MLTQSIDDSPLSSEAHNHDSPVLRHCFLGRWEKMSLRYFQTHMMQEYFLLLEMQLMLLEPSAKTKASAFAFWVNQPVSSSSFMEKCWKYKFPVNAKWVNGCQRNLFDLTWAVVHFSGGLESVCRVLFFKSMLLSDSRAPTCCAHNHAPFIFKETETTRFVRCGRRFDLVH